MATEVFFNRPARPISLDRMRADILGAKETLSVACAWFTLSDIADAIIASPAKERKVILNQADLSRNGGVGHRVIKRLERGFRDSGLHWSMFNVVVLGGTDYREGIMHHKFVVVDSRIVWTGSFNLTYQATKNYETLLRIEDADIAARFEDEAGTLGMFENVLWSGTTENAWNDVKDGGAFRCCKCERIFSDELMSWGFHGDETQFTCLNCAPTPTPQR